MLCFSLSSLFFLLHPGQILQRSLCVFSVMFSLILFHSLILSLALSLSHSLSLTHIFFLVLSFFSLSLSFSQIPCPENIVHGSSFEEDILPLVAFTTNVYTRTPQTHSQSVCKSVCGKKEEKKRTVYITRGSCRAHTGKLIVAFFCLCSSVPFDAFCEIKSLKNSGIRFYIVAST